MTNAHEPINSIPDLNNHPSGWYGLTKREYFDAMAMQGLLSNPAQIDTTDFIWIASHAIGYADALIKQLNQKTDETDKA